MSNASVHPSAVVHPTAKIGDHVVIGAYANIGENVSISNHTRIMHHAILDRNTSIGEHCKVFPFVSIGTDPQDISYQDEETHVRIGHSNIIREFTTINRGTVKGGGVTRIGDDNYFMAYTHIAHDCHIHNHVILNNGATLAGHVEIGDHAVLSAFSAVHQFVRIGCNAYIGGYTLVLQDILPFSKIAQKRNSYSFYGPNSIGMMRNGFSRDLIEKVKEIFHIIYFSDFNTTQAMGRIEEQYSSCSEARLIVEFIQKSKRGILKNFHSDG